MWLTNEQKHKLIIALESEKDGRPIHVFEFKGNFYVNGQKVGDEVRLQNRCIEAPGNIREDEDGQHVLPVLREQEASTRRPLTFEEILHLEHPFTDIESWRSFLLDGTNWVQLHGMEENK